MAAAQWAAQCGRIASLAHNALQGLLHCSCGMWQGHLGRLAGLLVARHLAWIAPAVRSIQLRH